jgi:hypothetical protein
VRISDVQMMKIKPGSFLEPGFILCICTSEIRTFAHQYGVTSNTLYAMRNRGEPGASIREHKHDQDGALHNSHGYKHIFRRSIPIHLLSKQLRHKEQRDVHKQVQQDGQ